MFESHARGNRYPQVELSEVARADPAVILLPSEPFRFRRRHRQENARPDVDRGGAQQPRLPGRWALAVWYGHRTREGLQKLEELLDRARPDWKAPPRPVKQSKTAAARKKGSKVSGAKAFPGLEDAAKKAGANSKSRLTPEQRAAAKKRAAQRSGKASKAREARKARKAQSRQPERKPKTGVEMPPGLRLRVEQQEVVEEE